ncbi:hypothetical protein [Bradyrhizobium sp. RDI18]|uniref:hypothetical protein n=1 Tax=Bradyrhizobium sp. RDI18 TaxID=3367400 RepID=UPI0037164418
MPSLLIPLEHKAMSHARIIIKGDDKSSTGKWIILALLEVVLTQKSSRAKCPAWAALLNWRQGSVAAAGTALSCAPPAFVVKEKRQPASDDFDVLQDALPKLNLLPKLAKITRCGGGYHAATNRILKTTKRRTNRIIHLGTYAKTTAMTPTLILPSFTTRRPPFPDAHRLF